MDTVEQEPAEKAENAADDKEPQQQDRTDIGIGALRDFVGLPDLANPTLGLLCGECRHGLKTTLWRWCVLPSPACTGARHGRRSCLLYTSPSPRDRQKSRMP